MLHYSSWKYCRCLLHGRKSCLRVVVPIYQQSTLGIPVCSRPSSSLNIDTPVCQSRENWYYQLSHGTPKMNMDFNAAEESTVVRRSEPREDVISALKSFFETFGCYNVREVLDDLPIQAYKMILSSFPTEDNVSAVPSNKKHIYDTVLNMKLKESLKRPLRFQTSQLIDNRKIQPAASSVCSTTENLQRRTFKTTAHFTTVGNGAVSCQEKVHEHPNRENRSINAKTKIASVEQLKQLTSEKDLNGIKKVLSECLWPYHRRLKTFIADLFELFITHGKDAREGIWLVDNFASACSRVVLPSSLIVQLIRRILNEEGVESAINYAHHYRGLLLTKPPPDLFWKNSSVIAENLFTDAFQRDQKARIHELCDIMIDLGLLRDSSPYLCAVVKSHLESNGFDRTFNLWYKNAQKYRRISGSHLLIRHTLAEHNLSDILREKRLRNILGKLDEFGAFYDGLAELVIELIRKNMICEAELVLKRLKISGRHYKQSLYRLKYDTENLFHIELFAAVFSSSILEETNIPRSQKSLRCQFSKTNSTVPSPIMNVSNPKNFLISLLSIWQPRCMQKFEVRSKKKFKADVKQLQEVTHVVKNVWFELATKANDFESLQRLLTWVTKYNSDEFGRLKKEVENFLEGKEIGT
ncbi:unnamed protein product [Thelazia callipaeda]|uniref:Pentatricopeptide repeat-containing protein n=1 Tax=Thelazia callipaeda TaxID=103827 RepID=A0A0N5CYU4_THECL|nr:unnamed protein product [Thelazia callipaeda]